MFVPETATEACRNLLRRCERAAAVSSLGSSERSAGASSIRSRKMPRTSERLRWIAGTTMCEGMSSASWTIISARSVSWAVMPRSARYSLRFVSWVAIDLTLTMSSTPLEAMMSVMIRLASAASRAQWTMPPRAVTLASNCSSSSGRREATSNLTASAALRRSSQSGISDTRSARLERMVRVAWPRLRRIWVLASVLCAPSGKVGPQRSVSSGCSTSVRHPPVWGIPRNTCVIVPPPVCAESYRCAGRAWGRRRCCPRRARPWWRPGSRPGA